MKRNVKLCAEANQQGWLNKRCLNDGKPGRKPKAVDGTVSTAERSLRPGMFESATAGHDLFRHGWNRQATGFWAGEVGDWEFGFESRFGAQCLKGEAALIWAQRQGDTPIDQWSVNFENYRIDRPLVKSRAAEGHSAVGNLDFVV